MTLFAIAIVWLLYEYTKAHHQFEQIKWFEKLISWLEPHLQKIFIRQNWCYTFLVFLPLFVIWNLYHVIVFSTGHFGRLILDTAILWYCWLYQESISVIPGTTRDKSIFIFNDALSEYFSVTFWFVLLGPLGALLYDFNRRAQKTVYEPFATFTRQILDWPAARLLGLGYSLAGHFNPAFSYWALRFFGDVRSNARFLEETGLNALNGDLSAPPADDKEPDHAKALVKRAEVMLIIVLAVFTLGSFFY